MSKQCFSLIIAFPIRDLNLIFLIVVLYFSARVSIAIKPTLWRVFSYLVPGLPKPMTIWDTGLAGVGGEEILSKSLKILILKSSISCKDSFILYYLIYICII